MGLFVLIIVAVVVAQTWIDWRNTNNGWVVPDWAKGLALGGVFAVSLAAAASFASVWLRDSAAQWTGGVGSGTFWFETGFLVVVMGAIVFGARRKRLRLALLIVCVVATAVFLRLVL